MAVIEILIVLIISLFVASIFYYIFKSKGPARLFMFFIVVFLASWAARLWIMPIAPGFLVLQWLPVLIVGIIFALILSVPMSTSNTSEKLIGNESKVKLNQDQTSYAISGFIWILLAILLLSIMVGYIINRLP
ncbi:MAG: hypothetical protein H0X62_16415 [Bacteroidetes bacterium]|nr:hypothetical protein [Bacteroidota bacterium]